MTDIDTVEISKQELKRLAKNEYMKNYMKQRRQQDPEFAERQRALIRKNLKNRYCNDAEYKQKRNEYDKNWYIQHKEAFELVQKMKNENVWWPKIKNWFIFIN